MRKSILHLFAGAEIDSSKRWDQQLLLLFLWFWCREETPWVRCSARRIPNGRPKVDRLWSGGEERLRVPYGPTCLGIISCISWLTAAADEYVSSERCVLSVLLLVSKPEPVPGDRSLATERRAARRPNVERKATCRYPAGWQSNSTIVLLLLLLAVVDNNINLESACHCSFRKQNDPIRQSLGQILSTWVVGFSKSKQIRSDSANLDCIISWVVHFRDRKIQIWSSKSKRID